MAILGPLVLLTLTFIYTCKGLPEDVTTCYQMIRYPKTHDSGSTTNGKKSEFNCIKYCIEETGLASHSGKRCYYATWRTDTTECFAHFETAPNVSSLVMGPLSYTNMYKPLKGPKCPPYVENAYTIDGCYITSMLGYVAFKAPGSKVVAGVADDRDCGSRCVADLTCTFFSWDATASQCLLFTSANTLTYFMDKQDNSVVGFIESCNTNEGCGFALEPDTSATVSTPFAAATFAECIATCQSLGARCYGFDWTESTARCAFFSAVAATQATAGTEHYTPYCPCGVTPLTEEIASCGTPSNAYLGETYGGNCQEFMEWFGQRKQTSNLDAPLSFQEVYDISPEQCISAVLDSTFAACMYDNTQPRPIYNGYRCWLYPNNSAFDTLGTATTANVWYYEPMGTGCPTLTDVPVVGSVCGIRQWPSDKYGSPNWAEKTLQGVSDDQACLQLCVADGSCFGCEFLSGTCYFYSQLSANWYTSTSGVGLAGSVRYTVDRNSCCA